jgi:hypothetical protein
MKKILIIALGLVTLGALVGVQPADARKKATPAGIGGGKPPAGPGHTSTGGAWVNSQNAPVIDPRELGPRWHPQPTDLAIKKH